MRRKTHEEYVKEVSVTNPHIDVIESYVNNKTPILHRCKIDGYEWLTKPETILSGCGCPKCSGKAKKTHEEYVQELSIKNPKVKVIDKYIDAKTKIAHHCLIHDVDWNTTPDNALHGKGCPQCRNEATGNRSRNSQEEYVKKLKNINPNINVLEQYMGTKIPILHECIIHNIKWVTSPASVLQGCGCPQCKKEKISIRTRRTNNQYQVELKSKNSNIEAIEDYIDSKTPILHRCLTHDFYWKVAPCHVLDGAGCLYCRIDIVSKLSKKTHQEYIMELSIINPDIEVIEEYNGVKTPILHRCKIHNYSWKTTPSSILQGCGCPKCNESFGERRIRQWLEKNNISYEFQKTFDDCCDIKKLPFDFYLSNYNSIIEYDGKQHYEPIEHFGGQKSFERTIKHDNIKNEYCKNNGISLLRIPYFKNVEEELNNFLFI